MPAARVGAGDGPAPAASTRRRRRRRSSAYLDWGFTGFEEQVGDHRGARRRGRPDPGRSSPRCRCPKRVAEMFGELAHELIMNAMYDAPVDAHGQPKYAADRKADVTLADDEQPTAAARHRRHAPRPPGARSVRPPRAPPRVRRARARAGRRRDGHQPRRRRARHDGVSQRRVGDVLRRRRAASTPRSPRCSSST